MAQNILPTETFVQDLSPMDTAFMPVVPVHKLDADQYMADDIDGFTDTVFGSGNMNFLAMQAAQTNEAMNNVSAQEMLNDSHEFLSNAAPGMVNYTPEISSASFLPTATGYMGDGLNNSLGSLNSALLNSNFQGFQSSDTGRFFSSVETDNRTFAVDGVSGTSGVDGTSGTSGLSGTSGIDGKDGDPGTGTVVNEYNTYVDTTEIIKNIYKIIPDIPVNPDNPDHDVGLNLDLGLPILDTDAVNLDLNHVLNPVEDIVGDVDLNLSPHLDLFGNSETSNAAGDTDINGLINGELLGQHLAGVDLQVALDAVENLTGDIDLNLTGAFNLLGDFAPGLIDNYAGGSGSALGQVGDALTDLVAPIVSPIVGDTHLDLAPNINLLNGADVNNTAGDTDIHLDTGISTLDQMVNGIELAPVEYLVGDIDLAADLNLDPLSSGDQLTQGAENLFVGLDTITTPLDDLTSHAVNMLEHCSPDSLDIYATVTATVDVMADIPWPEAGMIQGGDIIDHVTQMAQDILPDPVSDITSGLANIADHDAHQAVVGKISGLFG